MATVTASIDPSDTARSAVKTSSINRSLAIFVGIVVLAVIAFGGHLVASRRASDLRAAAADRTAAANYDTQAALGRRVEASATSYQHRLAAGKAAFPTRRDQAQIIKDLDALASRSGVVWSDGSQGATASVQGVPGPTKGLTPWDVSVSVQGSLSEVLAFVSGISHMPRAASPSALALTWQSGSAVKANLTVVAWSAGGAPSTAHTGGALSTAHTGGAA